MIGLFYTMLFGVWLFLFSKTLHSSIFTPLLCASASQCRRDSVDVLVPVRNEASRRLREFLEDLSSLNAPHLDIYITDDRSTDNSADIVSQASKSLDARIQLLHGLEPPPGWMGKTHALMQAKRAGSGNWLALVDADVRLKPDTVSRAIATARESGSSAVCVLPRFVYRSFWVGVVLPTMIWLSIMRVSPPQSNSLFTRSVFGFGNFILVNREAHDRVGGFDAYKSDVLDDCVLFHLLKSNGEKTLVVDGGECIESEMYTDLSGLISGFSKNSFAAVGYRWSMIIMTLGLIAASIVPILAIGIHQPLSMAYLVPMALTALIICFRLGAPIYAIPLFPVSLLICGWILMLSATHTGAGKGILWKGRLVR